MAQPAFRRRPRRRVSHEKQVLRLSVLTGLPGILLSVLLLWTGDYDPSLTKKILGFKLNPDGSLQTPAVYSFNLPITGLNGLACFQSSATDLWFYLQGGGVFRKVRYLKSGPNAVSNTVVFTAPGGTEDLTLVGTQVWTTNETGATSYQKRTNQSAWMEDLYPFLFGLNLP